MAEGDIWDSVDAASTAAVNGNEAAAWLALAPLLEMWRTDSETARALAVALGLEGLARERRLDLANEVLAAYRDNPRVLAPLGAAVETIVDRRYLNAAPPDAPFFKEMLSSLQRAFADGPRLESRLGEALATVARACGRVADDVCEAAHKWLLEQRPTRWQDHYNYGLFLKCRGRFAEGMRANQRAAELGGADEESVIWNLGICATGAGEGELALKLWREKLGATLDLGPDGLPVGRFHEVQVRLAQRPIAERTADADEPGLEESIWIERLSPCHGRIRSALYYDLGIDYGDLVLFDGAAIVTREWGDGRRVPVFPQLATLRRGGWRVFPFAGTQPHKGELTDLSFAGETILYAHTEMLTLHCNECWENPDQTHRHTEVEHQVVRGKLCIPPTEDLAAVDRALTEQLQRKPDVRLFVPALAEALGDAARTEREERLFALLTQNTS